MKKHRIVYIGGFELPDKNAAAHRVLGIGKILSNLDYDMVYIGISKDNSDNNNLNQYVINYPSSTKKWIGYLFNSFVYIKILKKLENVDAVILYNFPSFLSYKILKYCKKNSIKCIADVTEWYHSKTKNIIFDIVKNTDSFFRMRIINKKMDGLIVISSFLKKYYQKSKNVILVPPLVDINDKKWKKNFNNENNKNFAIKFFYAGDPGKKDRIDKIIRILNKCDLNYQFDIIGITKAQFLKLYDNIDEKIINKRIIFHGRVEHKVALSYLKECDALIFYRDNTIVSKAGFSTKFVEATTCGIPVITNITSDLSDYVKNGVNGIVLSDDFDNSLNIINSLTKEKLNKLKDNIDNELFSYEKYIMKVKEWINNFKYNW